MTISVRRASIRAASISLFAAVLTVLVACNEEVTAGQTEATATSAAPVAQQTASGTAMPGATSTVLTQTAGTGTSTAGASKDGASTKTIPRSADPRDAGVLYARCMRDSGVPNFPDPGPDGRFAINHGEGGLNEGDPKFRAALEECRDLAPSGDHRNTGDPAYVEQMREFSQCMRGNGLPDFPDPDAEGRLRGLGHEAQDNPKYRAAMEACAGSLPGGGAHR